MTDLTIDPIIVSWFAIWVVFFYYIIDIVKKLFRKKNPEQHIIYLSQLKDQKACQTQIDRFENFFGKYVIVTEELCEKHKYDFDFYWAAKQFLTDRQWQVWLNDPNRLDSYHKAFYTAFTSPK